MVEADVHLTLERFRQEGFCGPHSRDGGFAGNGPLGDVASGSRPEPSPLAQSFNLLKATRNPTSTAGVTPGVEQLDDLRSRAYNVGQRNMTLLKDITPRFKALQNIAFTGNSQAAIQQGRERVAKLKAEIDELKGAHLATLGQQLQHIKDMPPSNARQALHEAVEFGLALLNRAAPRVCKAETLFGVEHRLQSFKTEEEAATSPAARRDHLARYRAFLETLPQERTILWNRYSALLEAIECDDAISAARGRMGESERRQTLSQLIRMNVALAGAVKLCELGEDAEVCVVQEESPHELAAQISKAKATALPQVEAESVLGKALAAEYGDLYVADLMYRNAVAAIEPDTAGGYTPEQAKDMRSMAVNLKAVGEAYGELKFALRNEVGGMALSDSGMDAAGTLLRELAYHEFASIKLHDHIYAKLGETPDPASAEEAATAEPRPASPFEPAVSEGLPVAGSATIEESLAKLDSMTGELIDVPQRKADEGIVATFSEVRSQFLPRIAQARQLMAQSSESIGRHRSSLTRFAGRRSLTEASDSLRKATGILQGALSGLQQQTRRFSGLEGDVGRVLDECRRLTMMNDAYRNDPRSGPLTPENLARLMDTGQISATLNPMAVTSDGNPLMEVALDVEPMRIGSSKLTLPRLLLHMHLKPTARGTRPDAVKLEDIAESGAVSVKMERQKFGRGEGVQRVRCGREFGLRVLEAALK